MTRKKAIFPLFILAAVLSAVFVFLGLKLYFNQTWLNENISHRINGKSFVHKIGEATVISPTGNLKVGGSAFPIESKVSAEKLNILTKFYHTLSVDFAVKPSQQSLTLEIKTNNPAITSKKSILYTNQEKSSTFAVDDLVPYDSVITSITLSTPKLIDNYKLSSITLSPKDIGLFEFLEVIKHDLSQIFKPYNMQKYLLMPAYLLIILYVCILLICLVMISSVQKDNKLSLLWLTIIFTWFSLDLILIHHKLSGMVFFASTYHEVLEGIFSLSPWLLGIAICLYCFKRRYGLGLLVIGCGYIVGVFLTSIIISISQYYQYQMDWNIIWCSEVMLAAILSYFVRPNNCSIDEFRLEKASPNCHYFYTFILMIVCIIHVYIFTNRLAVDFLSLSEMNQSLQNPVHLSVSTSNEVSEWLNVYSKSQMNQPLSLALIWAGLLVALGCVTFGGLRYLGVSLLPAMLSSYAIISSPIWLEFSILEILYSNGLAVLCTSLLLFLVVSVLSFKEFRLLLLIIPILLIFALDMSTYSDFLTGNLQLTSGEDVFINLLLIEPSISSVLLNNSYILLPALILSLVIWLMSRRRNNESRTVNILFYLSMLSMVFPIYATCVSSANNGISLYLVNYGVFILSPIASLELACIYQIITKDDETLPII